MELTEVNRYYPDSSPEIEASHSFIAITFGVREDADNE